MPKFLERQVMSRIDRKELKMLSLDTSIIEKYNYKFEQGILRHLSQFSESDVEIVFSDIVIREIISRLLNSADEAKNDISRAVKRFSTVQGVDKAKLMSDVNEVLKAESPREIIEARINRFKSATNASDALTFEHVSSARLAHAYFNQAPPFEKRESKKSEFPDAMALQALEGYASKNNTLMLVVSADNGWKSYCDLSDHLICTDDLVAAMGYFHRVPSVADKILADRMDKFDLDIASKISDYVDYIDAEIISSSYHMYDYYVTGVRYRDFQYSDKKPLSLVSFYESHKSYVFESNISIDISIEVDFIFFKNDGKKFVEIGKTSEEQSFSIDASILVTIVGDLNGSFQVEEVEVRKIDQKFDFGEVDFEDSSQFD